MHEPGAEWLDGREGARPLPAARAHARRRTGRPHGRLPALRRLLVVGTFDPPAEAEPLRQLSRATSAYAMLKAERAQLEAVQVLFFLLLAFLVLLAAVWVGLLLARRVTRPIAALAASARRVGAGDFDALVEVEGGDEISALSRAFNAMTSELRKSRSELVAANAELAATNERVDEERRRVRTILARLDAGVVAFGDDGTLFFLNETARRLLGHEEETPFSRAQDLLARAGPRAARRVPRPRARGGRPARGDAEDRPPRARGSRDAGFPPGSADAGAWVVTLEDTTALVAAERAAAWEEAARRMAHEIKNPLTPIRLAAERMRRRARGRGRRSRGSRRRRRRGRLHDHRGGHDARLARRHVRALRAPAGRGSRPDGPRRGRPQVAKLYADVKRGVTVVGRHSGGSSARAAPTPSR